MALTGTLLRSGYFSEDEVYKLVRALCHITKDDEVAKRADAVERTIARKADNEPFTQWPQLQELIGEKASKKIGALLFPKGRAPSRATARTASPRSSISWKA